MDVRLRARHSECARRDSGRLTWRSVRARKTATRSRLEKLHGEFVEIYFWRRRWRPRWRCWLPNPARSPQVDVGHRETEWSVPVESRGPTIRARHDCAVFPIPVLPADVLP